jgi:zinc protease
VPRIDYRERKLGNGLTVLSVESHASPTVSVQVWYHVGGADDPEGKSGFAHLFEHMMFKGSKYMKSEQFDRITEDVGGENNASTSEDVTAYQAVVPSNHLETLLWAEAERLLNLKVDETNFRSERAWCRRNTGRGSSPRPTAASSRRCAPSRTCAIPTGAA